MFYECNYTDGIHRKAGTSVIATISSADINRINSFSEEEIVNAIVGLVENSIPTTTELHRYLNLFYHPTGAAMTEKSSIIKIP